MDFIHFLVDKPLPVSLFAFGVIFVLPVFFDEFFGFKPRPETRKFSLVLGGIMITSSLVAWLYSMPSKTECGSYSKAELSLWRDEPGVNHLKWDYTLDFNNKIANAKHPGGGKIYADLEYSCKDDYFVWVTRNQSNDVSTSCESDSPMTTQGFVKGECSYSDATLNHRFEGYLFEGEQDK